MSTIERRGRKGRKERPYSSAAFAAFAFQRRRQLLGHASRLGGHHRDLITRVLCVSVSLWRFLSVPSVSSVSITPALLPGTSTIARSCRRLARFRAQIGRASCRERVWSVVVGVW